MFKSKRKTKALSLLVLFLMVFCQMFSSFAVNAESQADDYNLEFTLSRPSMSTYENESATYSNYWMGQPANAVFDTAAWELKDFSIEYELHVEEQTTTVKKTMSYSSATYSFDESAVFNNIKIPYEDVEIEYYNAPAGALIEPHLLHYDLYLKKSNGKMILSVPRLAPSDTYTGVANNAKILGIENLRVTEINAADKNIYLNGRMGNDALDGKSEANAVKTFEKAKQLATANQNIKRIIVIGTTDIEGDVSLAGTNAKILRGDSFKDFVFSVPANKTATLTDITIDGNSSNNSIIEKSLVNVNNGAILNVSQGAVLKNNRIKDYPNDATRGGAIYVVKGTLNMNGGSVEANQATYGGGIYLYKSTMNFTGGIVKGNESKLVTDRSVSPTQYYSAGGGILADEGATINMSGNAEVRNNSAKEIGGGISLGSNQWGETNILNMDGGIIDGNTAGSAGGGIFVQAKAFSGGISKAYINSGEITNNRMDGSGVTEKMFGGGGIYVNGANSRDANGILYLKNVVITDNSADNDGAGYASCPISQTKIFVTNGAAIYGNHSNTNVNEIYLLCNHNLGPHSGNPKYNISKRMLGGVAYNWKTETNAPLPDDKHSGTLTVDNSFLKLNTDSVGNELTEKLTKVIIKGNTSATRGGGIGSNGTVIVGEDESIDISVKKVWDDNGVSGAVHPAEITVNLIATVDGTEYVIETKKITAADGWTTSFKNLPTKIGNDRIQYSVTEEAVDGYTAVVTGNTDDGFTITNTKVIEKTEVKVKKTWDDSNNKDGKRPANITVRLYADGVEVNGQTLTLSQSNNWMGSFANLDKYKNGQKIMYTIKEDAVEKGYTSKITGSAEDGYVITNTRNPNIPPKTPNTGDKSNLDWYLTMLGISGAMLIMAGLRKKAR